MAGFTLRAAIDESEGQIYALTVSGGYYLESSFIFSCIRVYVRIRMQKAATSCGYMIFNLKNGHS